MGECLALNGTGTEQRPRRGEPALAAYSMGNDELRPREHYGPGGDVLLVGLAVGEGDGLVSFSSTW